MEKLPSNVFYVVSLNYSDSGADNIAPTIDVARKQMSDYLQECRLRNIKGEVILKKVYILDYFNYTYQDFFDGLVNIEREFLIEKLTISFS